MYQIRCDTSTIYDPRDPELVLLNPRCKLAVNTVGEGSFTILSNHPCYGQLKKLRSIFEIRQDDDIIFRGRMTNDSRDFYNQLDVDLEGVLAFTNDSIIPPFNFPDDFSGAANATNVVEYFLKWLIETQHNGQVEDWQKLYVGTVTVADPNNVITRSSDSHMSTWDALKTKLFESSLGGYLCIRYEEDGTFIDYLERFEDTNRQGITFGENLLDINSDSDASETYSAILPLGAKPEGTDTQRLTLASLPDGNLTDDLVKKGNFIYSKSAVEQYGWICVPVGESTWDDVKDVNNLKTKAMAYLSGSAMLFSSTITIKAVDMHFTDKQIQSFRIYRNTVVNSPVHGVVNANFPLTQLEIDIVNVQNTIITIGDTVRTLIDINDTKQSTSTAKVEQIVQQATATGKQVQVQLTYLEADTADLQDQIDGLSEDVVQLFEDTKDLRNMADSVTEIGTSDLWTFRKWSSGVAECWQSIDSENVTDALTYPIPLVGDPCIQTTEINGKTHYYVIGRWQE